MTELAPDHQNEILKCGYEYGYNRQIVGYHWFTDVIATRQLASALYAYLHSDAEFQKLMQEARKEYQSMTASAIRTVTPDDNDMKAKVDTLLAAYPSIDITAMGFPRGCESEPLWQ